MKPIKKKIAQRKRRHYRIRKVIIGTKERPRLSVFRSLNNIYCQLIDDVGGETIASASSFSKDIKDKAPYRGNKNTAELVGAKIATEAVGKGIKDVIFDRGGYKYHGRVKSLAESAKKQGLNF